MATYRLGVRMTEDPLSGGGVGTGLTVRFRNTRTSATIAATEQVSDPGVYVSDTSPTADGDTYVAEYYDSGTTTWVESKSNVHGEGKVRTPGGAASEGLLYTDSDETVHKAYGLKTITAIDDQPDFIGQLGQWGDVFYEAIAKAGAVRWKIVNANPMRDGLIYQPGKPWVLDTSSKILSWGAVSSKIHSGNRWLTILGSNNKDLSSVTGQVFGVITAPDSFLHASATGERQTYTGGAITLIDAEDTSAEALRARNTIILFFYDATTGNFHTPFNAAVLQAEFNAQPAGRLHGAVTQDKLSYYPTSEWSWNHELKLLYWGAGTSRIMAGKRWIDITGPGSITFTEDSDGNPITTMAIAYIEVSDTFRDGTSSDNSGSKADSDIIVRQRTHADYDDIRNQNVVIIAEFNGATGILSCPFLDSGNRAAEYRQSLAASGWAQYGPEFYAKLPKTVQKLNPAYAADADDTFRIVMVGDSIFAREWYNSFYGDASTERQSMAPMTYTRNICGLLAERLAGKYHYPTYRRWDYAAAFTETGTFAQSYTDASWDDASDRPGWTRYSDTDGASVEFTVPSTFDGFNWIDRTASNGTTAASITVTGGDGLLQYWNGSAWVEANGASISQLETSGTRRGNTVYQRRTKFKKVGSGVGVAVTVTITNTVASTRLLYWGLEMYDLDRPHVEIINTARGSHELLHDSWQLVNYLENDILGHKPDLVIFEIPLLNMTYSRVRDAEDVQDFIWGDRVGATNGWNLKAQSNDWADWELLVVIPHNARDHFDAAGEFKVNAQGDYPNDIYAAVRRMIDDHGDVACVDVASQWLRTIDNDPAHADRYDAMNPSDSSFYSNFYTWDQTHPNDAGALVYLRALWPVFERLAA